MIIPGEITLEILVEPVTYYWITHIIPPLFGALSGFTSHLIMAQKKYRTLQGYSASIIAGGLVYLAVSGLTGSQVEIVSGLDGLISLAIITGFGGRALLPKLSKRFQQHLLDTILEPENK